MGLIFPTKVFHSGRETFGRYTNFETHDGEGEMYDILVQYNSFFELYYNIF